MNGATTTPATHTERVAALHLLARMAVRGTLHRDDILTLARPSAGLTDDRLYAGLRRLGWALAHGGRPAARRDAVLALLVPVPRSDGRRTVTRADHPAPPADLARAERRNQRLRAELAGALRQRAILQATLEEYAAGYVGADLARQALTQAEEAAGWES